MLPARIELNISIAGRIRPRALAVDDDPIRRDVFRRLLARCGFDADVALNGQDAIHEVSDAQAIREPFELVLMDSDMPVVNGWVASSTVRRNGYAGRLVLVSDGIDSSTPARCASCGIDYFLFKPATADVVISAINACSTIPNRRHRRSRHRKVHAPIRLACAA